MATQKCAICGAEVNLLQQQKLADGNFICRKTCKKQGFKVFDYPHSTLDQVKAHNEQIVKGTKIWNELLAKDKDSRKKLNSRYYPMYVSEETGLIALVEKRYKFFIFGKEEFACVFRLADLDMYEPEITQTTGSDGKPHNEYKIHYSFTNTFGLCDFTVKTSGVNNGNDYKKLKKYYDTFFGIQDTLGNFVNKGKSQFAAIKSAVDVAKAMKDGGDVDEKAMEAGEAFTKMLKGDRQKWIDLADRSLASFN